ncbi:MAG: hypothetical protein Q4B80_04345 [Aerococcaceae bacterium]|nr:hypothetical protein [Aerococcaceae bacterium]
MLAKFKKITVSFLLLNALFPAYVSAEKVDLSPIPSLESSSESAESSSQAATTGQAESATTVQLSMEQPASLVNAIRSSTHVSSDFTLVIQQGETPSASTRSYIRHNNGYYIRTGAPNEAASSVQVELSSDKKIQRTFLPVDDLMSYTAELVNKYPEQFQGTTLEQFYQLVEADASPYVGKYVETTTQTASYQTMVDELIMQEHLMVTLVDKWLATNPTPTAKTDASIKYDITEENKATLTEIVRALEADYPLLQPFFELFPDGYIGTIQLDFQKQEIGIGLVSEQGAIEYYISLSDLPIQMPESNQILTEEAFTEMNGFDLFEGISTVAPQEEETNE